MKDSKKKSGMSKKIGEKGMAAVDTKISERTGKRKEKDENKTVLTVADLKGKKVDGDPELESDQPIDQLHPEKE